MTGKCNSYVAIVDDDESVCRSFGRFLRTAGFQPVTYSSGEAFLEDSKRPHFDCLLLDIQMGGISGVELSKRLSAVNDHTPVIFLTAQDCPKLRAEAEATDCRGYFSKNEPGATILNCLEQIIAATPGSGIPHDALQAQDPTTPKGSK